MTRNVRGAREDPPPAPGTPLTVAVTRPLPAGRELAGRLEGHGFRALLCPTLAIAPPPDPAALRGAAVRSAEGFYDWTVFTSGNAARALAGAFHDLGGGARPRSRVAVVGPATAGAVRDAGWAVDRIPATSTAEGLLAEFGDELDGLRVLMPAAEQARDVLPEGLRRRGASVDVVVAYRSVIPPEVATLRDEFRAGRVQLLTFASPSSASNLVEIAGEEVLAIPAVVIGPVTGEAAERLGFRVVAVARRQNTAGLVDAVVSWAGRQE